jgi:hypothetical protein
VERDNGDHATAVLVPSLDCPRTLLCKTRLLYGQLENDILQDILRLFRVNEQYLVRKTTKPTVFNVLIWGEIRSIKENYMDPIELIEEFQQINAICVASNIHVTYFYSTLYHRASNPRDKIYAVPGFSQSGLVRNYQTSVKDIYVEFACQYLSYYNDLSFWRFACLGYSTENDLNSLLGYLIGIKCLTTKLKC